MSELHVLSEEQQFTLAMHLHNEGMFGVHEDPAKFIILKNQRISPHYLNMREAISSKASRRIVADSLLSLANIQDSGEEEADPAGFPYDHIAGTPEAFTSFIPTMADLSEISLLQPRVGEKKVGNKAPILGRYKQGDSVALFDDVVTDGQTKVDAIDMIRSAGLEVGGYFVVLDRQEGGAQQVLTERGIAIQSALRVADTVRLMRAEGVYSVTQFDNVKEYLQQYATPEVVASMGSAL